MIAAEAEDEDDEDVDGLPDTPVLPADLEPLLEPFTEAQRATLLRLGVASALGSCSIETSGDDDPEELRELLTRIIAQVDALERDARAYGHDG